MNEKEKRRQVNDKIVEWIKSRTETRYAGEISLVLVYGSYVNGTANEKSDVDCCFIPKTQKGYDMAVTFILDGVGYDLFPLPWERAEGIAQLKESLLPLVGDAQILYQDTPEDGERFRQLQRRLRENLQDGQYRDKAAGERFCRACELYGDLLKSERTAAVRRLAGEVLMLLADAVALHCGEYYHFGLKKQYEDLRDSLSDVPETFVTAYDELLKAADDAEFKTCGGKLLQEAGAYLGLSLPEYGNCRKELTEEARIQPDYRWLAGLYEEICSTFQKIYICCRDENVPLAFLSAVCLQRELDEAAESGGRQYDLLGAYCSADLGKLAERARQIETDFVGLIVSGGGSIRRYDCVEELAAL